MPPRRDLVGAAWSPDQRAQHEAGTQLAGRLAGRLAHLDPQALVAIHLALSYHRAPQVLAHWHTLQDARAAPAPGSTTSSPQAARKPPDRSGHPEAPAPRPRRGTSTCAQGTATRTRTGAATGKPDAKAKVKAEDNAKDKAKGTDPGSGPRTPHRPAKVTVSGGRQHSPLPASPYHLPTTPTPLLTTRYRRPSARGSRFDARSPRRCERWLEVVCQGLGASHKPPFLENSILLLVQSRFLRSTARSQVDLLRSEQDCSHGHGTDQSELWCCRLPQLPLVSGLLHLPFERGVGGTGPGQ